MPGLDLNELTPPNLLPSGSYKAEIISAEEETSRMGNQMVVVQFRIQEEGDYEGRVLKDWIVPISKWGKSKLRTYKRAFNDIINEGDRCVVRVAKKEQEGDTVNNVIGVAGGWDATPDLFLSPNPETW